MRPRPRRRYVAARSSLAPLKTCSTFILRGVISIAMPESERSALALGNTRARLLHRRIAPPTLNWTTSIPLYLGGEPGDLEHTSDFQLQLWPVCRNARP